MVEKILEWTIMYYFFGVGIFIIIMLVLGMLSALTKSDLLSGFLRVQRDHMGRFMLWVWIMGMIAYNLYHAKF